MMKTIEVLTENNISLTALVVHEYCNTVVPAYPRYICYAQNRLFHYYNEEGLWKMEIIAEYIVCPEWDNMLTKYKTFTVIIKNAYGDIRVFNCMAECEQDLYTEDYAPSSLLKNKILHDTTLFASYSEEDIDKCIVECVEDSLVMI